MSNVLTRIYVPGGVLSPGELRRIVNAAQYFGTENIHMGNRQDLLFSLDKKYVNEIPKRLAGIQYHYEIEKFFYSNIATSFSAKNIANSTPWLTEGLYLEILSSFDYKPKLKVNIVDPCQSMVPLFNGDLNFVASPFDNYWYLFIKFDENQKPEMWPVLVDGNEIHILAQAIEDVLLINRKISIIVLEVYIYNLRTWNFKIILQEFSLPVSRFINYEGFHPLGDKYWLGIYNRDNSFSINFIESLCILCARTNIGSINLTPWNSFIIKNIQEKDIPLWEQLLGKFGINTGHSHLELNWQIPELDMQAHKIKNYLFRSFEKNGLRADGLVFGFSESSIDPTSSVFITRKTLPGIFKNWSLFTTYGIKYKKNFNVNSSEVQSFADGLRKRNLPNMLAYVVGLYYDSISKDFKEEMNKEKFDVPQDSFSLDKKNNKYQCKHCLTVYDSDYGDKLQGIGIGVEFEDLPSDYICPLCAADKSDFVPVSLENYYVKAS